MKIKSFLLLAFAAGSLASCSKMGALSADNFTVVPSPLEAVSNEVPVTINGRFPEKYMKKKATMTITPTIEYQGQKIALAPIELQGQKAKAKGTVIPFKTT